MKRIFGFIFVSLFVNIAFADTNPDLYSELNCTDFGCGTAFPKCDPNTFSIAYDAGGGAGNAPMTPVSCKYGEECFAPENTYVRDNYTFLHWICKKSDNTDCEQSTYYTGDSISTATTTDNDTITLTANWMIDGFYSIKYNMLGGALSAELSGSRTDSCNQESDIIELPTLTRANSRFEGWYTDSKFATKITEIKTGECSGDMELYAKWSCDNGYKSSEAGDACTEINYAITYNLNGGTNTSRNPETYKITDNTIILVHPTRANSTFDGWYADAEFTTKIESIDSGSTGDLAVYAKWSCNEGYAMSADGLSCIGNTITIVYNTEGGTAVESTTCTYGEMFTITSTTSKTGYTFSGWKFVGDNIVKDITTEVMCDNSLLGIYEGSYTTVAQWTANNYNVTYYCVDDSTTAKKEENVDFDSEYTVAQSTCEKVGYTFAGWAVSDTETVVNPDDKFIWNYTEDKTLTAQWTLNSYECVAGQYLPAGATECATCMAGSYCVGGTYNYDTSKAQGISECPADFREGGTGLESEGACIGSCTVSCEPKTCPEHSTNCVHGSETATGTMTYGNQSCSATAPVCSMTFDCVDGYNKSGDGCVAGDMNTITYNTDGGKINSSKVDSCNVESGDIVLPTDVTKTGYTFNGWYDANGAKVETIASGSCISPITLTAQWTACPVCNAGTGATCELSVVNNQCVYTTGCENGYYNEQGSGTTSPSCESCVKSCSGNSNGFTLGKYNVCNNETAAQCYRDCVESDVKGSLTVSGKLSAGGTNSCVATSCASNNYLSGGTCIACDSGFSSPNNNTGGISSCTKTCEVSCSGYAECPENATCEYDTNRKTSGTQTQGGKCSVDAEECPLVDFTCNDGYSKTADGNACESAIFSVIYHLDGGINYNGAPTSFDAKYGVSINGKPTKAGYEFVGWSRFEDLSHPSNGVGVLPDAATGDLHVWAIWSLCPSGSYCDGVRYLCPETHPSSVVGSATISACYKSCEAIEQDNTVLEPVASKAYYPNDCKYISETTCKPGFEKKNGKCVPCSYDDNVLTYTKGCEIESCVSGYHPNGDKCDSDTISCSVSHAVSAVQKWNSVKKAYDKCMIAECDDGYHIDANACVPDEESCEIANGTGVREWNHRTNSWGECIATRCDPGYTNDSSQTNEAWNQCGRCNNAYSAGGELAVSSYVNECEIASCLYQGELYALENNECRLICEEYSDETGRRYWDSSRKKCVHDCADGYTSW